jgi:hypothetical protein
VDRVFRDVESIRTGADFVALIDEAVGRSSAVVAVIDRDWLTTVDEAGGRRLDGPDDFVRLELEAAFARGVPVAPVLVEGARMPPAGDLPSSIARISRLNAVEVTDSRWDHDVHRLVEHLETLVGEAGAEPTGVPHAADADHRTPDGEAVLVRHRLG